MSHFRSVVIAAIVLIAPLSVSDGWAQAGGGRDYVVNCYDPARDTVSRVLKGACAGEVVSEEQADELRQRRVDRIRRRMQPRKKPPARGKLVGIGTGFFVTDDGKLVTNHHVVDRCKAFTIETTTGKTLPAKLIDKDKRYDLALLDAGVAPPGVAAFRDIVDLEPGERADLVGYPTQGIPPIEPIFTAAIYHKRCLKPGLCAGFQIKGDVRSGNSGGPVLDDGGRVIGVVFARFNTVKIFERTGQVVRDVGLAVQNVIARQFLDTHRVAYRLTRERETLTREETFAAAKPFVARVGCWR